MEIDIAFTDELLAREPQLQQLQYHLPNVPGPVLGSMSLGDTIRLEGIPVARPPAIVGRQWTVMQDEVRLLLVLDATAS